MASYSCLTCDSSYKDILEHIRKKHPTEAYTDQQLQPLNLARCPHCSTACQGAQGIKAHSAKIHRIRGTSNISTLPRIRTYPATRAQYQPHPSTIALAKELAARRKRPAKTPSLETAISKVLLKVTSKVLKVTSKVLKVTSKVLLKVFFKIFF
ncbi:hypothetical protein QSH57_014386 [Fusarium oxysporum f. sp. vasinfectum]|nr:hypothetical protein QSH57_014386 [Fusarium oxysporum f. sp. vasinfectum]